MQKKLAGVNVSISRLRDVIDKPDYAVKVPREVQDANVSKVCVRVARFAHVPVHRCKHSKRNTPNSHRH